jgi:hypothetical protein
MMQALHIYKKGPQLYILEEFYIFRERQREKGNPVNDQHIISHNKIFDITHIQLALN